jgi:hypothetical protein
MMLVSSKSSKELGLGEAPFAFLRRQRGRRNALSRCVYTVPAWIVPVTLDLPLLTQDAGVLFLDAR